MAQNTIEIRIITDGKKAHAELVRTGKGAEQLGKSAKQASTQTGGLGKNVLSLQSALSALGLGAVVAKFGAFAAESFKAAAAAERLGTATNNLAQAIGSSGDEMVNAIVNASNETVSRTAAMQAANKAMLFGIVENSSEMARMTEIAVTLGAAMGQDATKSVDDLTTALGRQSPMILDNLGITLKLEEAYRIRAQQLNKSVEALTEEEKKQAFLNAALAKGEERVKALGGVTLDSAAKAEQLSAAWADFTVAFGGLLTQMAGGLSTLTAFVRKLEEGAQAWDNIFSDMSAIKEYNLQVAEADKATVSTIQALTGVSDAYIASTGAIEESVKATHQKVEAEAEAARFANMYAESNRIVAETEKERAVAQIDALAQSEAAYKAYGEELAATDAKIAEAAIELFETQQKLRRDLANETASFYIAMKELGESHLADEADFNSQLADIRSGGAEKSKETATALSEELEKIEQERADKLHWVMTGAHDRTAEENAAALAHWNAHYDELTVTAQAKAKEKTDAILAEQSRAESAAAAAREKERAEYQAHLDELKLKTALGMLETSGQLEQITGLVGISASEAADLISAGIIPVTEDLGVAMQDTLSNLESNMGAAAETAAANQDMIQQAMDGTLDSTSNLGVETTAVFDAMNTQVGTTIPASVNTASEATAAFTVSATENTNLLIEDALIPLQDLLDMLTLETIPALEIAYTTACEIMMASTDTLIAAINRMVTAINAAETAAKNLATSFDAVGKSADGFEKAADAIEDTLIPALREAEKWFYKVQDAADAATDAARQTGEGIPTGGGGGGELGMQHGTPPGGFLVPSSFGIDEFPARFSGGERIFAYPNDKVPASKTINYYFNQTVNTQATTGTTVHDFETARAIIGLR